MHFSFPTTSRRPNRQFSEKLFWTRVTEAARRGILADVILELTVASMTAEDVVEFELNERTLPPNPELDIPPPHYKVGPGHNEYSGNYRLRYRLVQGSWLRRGSNVLHVVLRRRNPSIRDALVLHDLVLEIRYRVLPLRV